MIIITIFQNHDQITGFRCLGHSGYADAGSDIICAGVSALVINTINAIDTFTDSVYRIDTEEESGLIDFELEKEAGHDALLLVRSMVLGLQGIQNDYGNEFIILNFKEV